MGRYSQQMPLGIKIDPLEPQELKEIQKLNPGIQDINRNKYEHCRLVYSFYRMKADAWNIENPDNVQNNPYPTKIRMWHKALRFPAFTHSVSETYEALRDELPMITYQRYNKTTRVTEDKTIDTQKHAKFILKRLYYLLKTCYFGAWPEGYEAFSTWNSYFVQGKISAEHMRKVGYFIQMVKLVPENSVESVRIAERPQNSETPSKAAKRGKKKENKKSEQAPADAGSAGGDGAEGAGNEESGV